MSSYKTTLTPTPSLHTSILWNSYTMNLTPVELSVLAACQDALMEKKKLIAKLANTLCLEPRDIFYHWIGGKLRQHGYVTGNQWKYFFHGLECDLRHSRDDRFLRIEFGPGGRIDTFTDWGIYQFITSFKDNWPSSPAVAAYFSKNTPFHHVHATEQLDAYQKISFIINRLKSLKLTIPVAPELTKALNGCSVKNQGSTEIIIQLPKHLTDHKYFDTRVCNRLIISPKGWEVLSKHTATAAETTMTEYASAA